MTITVKYLTVVLLSMGKFVLGPVTAYAMGLGFWEMYGLTVTGMMLTVAIIGQAGGRARRWSRKLRGRHWKLFTPRHRRIVRIWRRYGLAGVAFLTPLLFSPVGGAMIAISFGERKGRLMLYMLAAALFWGAVFSAVFQVAGQEAMKWLGR